MADAQVTAWLRHAGLSRFAPRFTAALVSRNAFLHLSPSDLDALGVDAPSDRKRLLDLIADLRRASSLPPHVVNAHSRSRSPRAVQRSRSFNRPMPMDPTQDRHILEQLDRNSHITEPADDTISLSGTSDTGRRNHRVPRNSSLSMSMTSVRDRSNSPRTAPQSPYLARVKVCVRKRPLSTKELASSNRDIVTVQSPDNSLFVHELKERVDLTKYVDTHAFTFDRVFGENASNSAVYDGTARPLVDALFEGGRSTCFAYGQTGAGKTFTMAGDGAENPGLYTLAVRDVFDRIRNIEREQWMQAEADGIDDFEPPDPTQVWISFYEIYASKLQDLLNRQNKLECREDSNNEVQIVGLTEEHCEVEEEVLAFIEKGSAARSTGVTGANDDSSRSHAIFQIELRHPPSETVPTDASTAMRKSLLKGSGRNNAEPQPPRGAEIGRLCFIDLAGSERGSDTASSTRQTRMEGAEINKSLLALKECIRAMDKRKDHTPFRGSKLTQVLKASFIGKNCRTVMIANISPASSNVEHTLNTLRYSDRVKEIKAVKSNAVDTSGTKLFGGRRATFSHGIGLRAGRNAPMSTPVKKVSAVNVEDVDQELQGGREQKPFVSPDNERMPDRPRDSEENLASVTRASSRLASGRRAFSRSRAQGDAEASTPMPGNATQEPQSAVKGRESRLLRRRNSRTPSQIPPRPSAGGGVQSKSDTVAGSKGAAQEKSTTSNVATDSSSCEEISLVTPAKPKSKELTRSHSRGGRKKDEKPTPAAASAMKTRQKMRENKASSPRKKRSESALPSDGTERAGGGVFSSKRSATPLKTGNSSSNVAQSAMKHYWTNRKDELVDDDILFPSCDDLGKHMTSEVRQRLGAVSISRHEPVDDDGVVSSGNDVVTADDDSSNSGGQGSIEDDRRSDSPTSDKSNLRSVVRLHHVQIEELMRLTEADVALVNAAEKGEIDPQEYALKLGLNLSQKIDIVKALQSKLKQLD